MSTKRHDRDRPAGARPRVRVFRSFDPPQPAAPPPAPETLAVPGPTSDEVERHAILTIYEACGRSPERTAELLGLSPRTVQDRLREYLGESGRPVPRRARGSPRQAPGPDGDGSA